MGELTSALHQMLVMMAIIAIGLVAARSKLLDDSMLKKLTRFLVYVTLPCMVLGSVDGLHGDASDAQLAWTFFLAFLLMGISVLGTLFFNAVFRTPRDERALFLFMSVCTNMGFIGISVASAIYGTSAVFSASVFVLVSNVSIFSLGFMILDIGMPRKASLRPKSSKDVLKVLRSLLNPSTVACGIALAVFALDLHTPTFIQDVLEAVGGVTAPMAMMLVGVIIAGIHPSEVVKGWRIYAFIAFRQVLVPIIALTVLHEFSPDPMALRVFVIMAAMPVGSMAPMIAADFGYDSTLVAKATVLSTVFSLAIVPMLLALLVATPVL